MKSDNVKKGMQQAPHRSLFNALVGDVIFETGVVRTTINNQEKELENYLLVDTPGLDACREDTKIAIDGYREADVILFVHNLQDGELNSVEVDAIKSISNIFDNNDIFFKNVILVLTHRDQVEDNYESIQSKIIKQCDDAFHAHFCQTYCVDSVGYLKGIHEKKELLVSDSGIQDLQVAIEKFITDDVDLKRAFLDKEKVELLGRIEQEINHISNEMRVFDESFLNAKMKLLQDIKDISSNAKGTVNQMDVSVQSFGTKRSDYWGRNERGYDYSSEYQAKEAGKTAIDNNIRKMAKDVRQNCLSIIEDAERYVVANGVPEQIRDVYATAYEKIRSIAMQRCNLAVSSGFDMIVNIPDEANGIFRYVRDKARYIDADSFSSASHYATMYSSDLYIDYDIRTEWVSGLFGGHDREYKVYSYDASGAIDNVMYDAAEKCSDFRSVVLDTKPSVKTLFGDIKQDLTSQFDRIVNTIVDSISKEISELETEKKHVKADNADKIKIINEFRSLGDNVKNI